MEILKLKWGTTLEYDDDTHTYIVDGVIVPSVTQILAAKFGNKYANVNTEVLKRAAERGTAIHRAIEEYCTTGKDNGSKEVHNFNFLMTNYALTPIQNEVPIIIFDEKEINKPLAAGRLDLVLVDFYNYRAIADLKTTATLDKEYLTYQLNLYRIGYMQCYGWNITDLYGVHLRDNKRKLVEIPINKAIAWDALDNYERSLGK